MADTVTIGRKPRTCSPAMRKAWLAVVSPNAADVVKIHDARIIMEQGGK
jgi:hypothetical protein